MPDPVPGPRAQFASPVTMTAMRVHRFGEPDVIEPESIDIPRPEAGEVLIRVHAAGVGRWDAWVRSGHSALPQPLPLTLGSDVSGCVAAVGQGVTLFVPSDKVYGVTNARFTGGYADYALCQASMIAAKPRSLSHVEAASAPVVAVTAYQMLFDHAALKAGQRVLIHGAAGSVGGYAVQLAHGARLEVWATGARRHTADLLALGADRVIDRDLGETGSVDAVIDLVGGADQRRLFDFLAPGGTLVSAVQEPDRTLADERGIRAAFILVDVRSETLTQLATMFDRHRLKPRVGTVLPLTEARRAHQMLAGTVSHAPGKIVLEIRR